MDDSDLRMQDPKEIDKITKGTLLSQWKGLFVNESLSSTKGYLLGEHIIFSIVIPSAFHSFFHICSTLFQKGFKGLIHLHGGFTVRKGAGVLASGKEPTSKCRRHKRPGFNPSVWRSPGGGHGRPLQYCCLENSMDKGVWQAPVHAVTKSQTHWSDLYATY